MIAHLDDFRLWVYVLVDDMCQALEGYPRRPDPKPVCSDIELDSSLSHRRTQLPTDHKTGFP